MKTSTLVFLGLVFLSGFAQAQCGCATAHYSAPPRMPMPNNYIPSTSMHSTHMHSPVMNGSYRPTSPMQSYSPGTIAYVNELSPPVQRPTYTLKYAVHLTNGRILLSDFLPSGQTVSGTEYQSGGRKLVASVGGYGAVTVTDPQNNQTVATFDGNRK